MIFGKSEKLVKSSEEKNIKLCNIDIMLQKYHKKRKLKKCEFTNLMGTLA
jgi:hypothetical protein